MGLEAALAGYFLHPIAVRQFVSEWLAIPAPGRCRLGGVTETATLGINATIGASTWQCQHKFEIVIGPLTMAQFVEFLPGARALTALRDLVRLYTNDEWSWQVRLLLKAEEVPRARLDSTSRLGWTTWMGGRSAVADDVVLRGDQAVRA
jgi:type VI secretion system protein ImpH